MARQALAVECVHRWVLGAPQGEAVHGVCIYCGAERDFAAEIEGMARRQVTPLFRGRGLARRRTRYPIASL